MAWYRHKKRGTVYEIISSTVSMQCSAAPEFERQFEDDHWTIYRNVQTGTLWVRPTPEFEDGRFERIENWPPSSITRNR